MEAQDIQSTFSEEQKSLASELGITLQEDAAPPSEIQDTEPPAPDPNNPGVESPFVSSEVLSPLFETAVQPDDAGAENKYDDDIVQQHNFFKKTGIKSYEMYERVKSSSQEVKTPDDQINLLVTLAEVESGTVLSPKEREELKGAFEQQFGVRDGDFDQDTDGLVIKKMQLQKEVRQAIQKMSELKQSISTTPPNNEPVDVAGIKSVILDIAKKPISIAIEGQDFKYTPAPDKVAGFYAEVYALAVKSGADVKGDDFAQKAQKYVELRARQEMISDIIEKAIQYGYEKKTKEVALGRYTPSRQPSERGGEGTNTLENFLFGS